ncbi:MAG: PQQ-dependent sugar dehydrogenase [Chitinophagaceae bacterium]|nr:PQQ-dependent sugar dehydrogenase [Chitinophagaceae bacterium]
MKRLVVIINITFCLLIMGCQKKSVETIDYTQEPTIDTATIINNRDIIWGMDFFPSGAIIFGEKQGKLYHYENGLIREITGLPAINSDGQGGLLDIRVHPNYSQNGWIYCTYAATISGGRSWNLARFSVDNFQVKNFTILLRTATPNTWGGHYGSRIDFDKNGYLFVSVGEGGTGSYGGAGSSNLNAQNVNTNWGKIHRLFANGDIPSNNPVLGSTGVATSVYSYGHRNPQGLIVNPFTQEVWETEHGPKGGDEINVIKAGANYGWPLVSFGLNYDGTQVSSSPTRSDIEAPIHTWTPSIAPSGMAFITNDQFKKWKGNLLVGSLAFRYLSKLELEGNRIVGETKLFENIGRVRNVKQGPDGSIYISIEGPGRILKISTK